MAAERRYASPVDTQRFGDYRITRTTGDQRPLYRFTGRLSADGSTGWLAEPGRYHLYAGWFCPWSQRVTIEHALHGLADVISLSYVDDVRDGRGWAFRATHGPDPINGFQLLRQAYEATEPGFDGHISVPTLWDRRTGTVVSNDFRTLGIDLATQFGAWSSDAATYPAALAAQIEELDHWLGPAINQGAGLATGSDEAALSARTALLDSFARLDQRLASQRFLLGHSLTEADIRLWVTLVRFDASTNARQHIDASLPDYPQLWSYARDLYQLSAFRQTTDFATFSATGAPALNWDQPHARDQLSTYGPQTQQPA